MSSSTQFTGTASRIFNMVIHTARTVTLANVLRFIELHQITPLGESCRRKTICCHCHTDYAIYEDYWGMCEECLIQFCANEVKWSNISLLTRDEQQLCGFCLRKFEEMPSSDLSDGKESNGFAICTSCFLRTSWNRIWRCTRCDEEISGDLPRLQLKFPWGIYSVCNSCAEEGSKGALFLRAHWERCIWCPLQAKQDPTCFAIGEAKQTYPVELLDTVHDSKPIGISCVAHAHKRFFGSGRANREHLSWLERNYPGVQLKIAKDKKEKKTTGKRRNM